MGVGWVGWVGWMSFLVSHASVCSQKFSPHLLHLHLEHRHLPTELSSICLQYAAKVLAAGQVYVLRSIALFQEHGSSWIRHVGLPNHKHSKKTTQKNIPWQIYQRGRGIVSIRWIDNLTSSHHKHAACPLHHTCAAWGHLSLWRFNWFCCLSSRRRMSQTRPTRSGYAWSFQKIAMGSFKCPCQEFQVCQSNGWFMLFIIWPMWPPRPTD